MKDIHIKKVIPKNIIIKVLKSKDKIAKHSKGKERYIASEHKHKNYE